ncbi:MAG: DUF4157 domain-containing protein, partial [Gammaproteobacteria bacterium]|nr:DUF4157 domain-containing protein [Gammaproteobacteria bacterium]
MRPQWHGSSSERVRGILDDQRGPDTRHTERNDTDVLPVQRLCDECAEELRRQPIDEEEEEALQTSSDPGLQRQVMDDETEDELLTRGTSSGAAIDRALQARLEVGRADDPFEREADRVADAVMRMSASEPGRPRAHGPTDSPSVVPGHPPPLARQITPLATSSLQRRCARCDTGLDRKLGPNGEQEDELSRAAVVQRAAQGRGSQTSASPVDRAGSTPAPSVNASLEQRIRRTRAGGEPLPDRIRQFMEPRFGADFSSVRVHHDRESNRLSHALNARAFAVGRHIYFNERRYRPDSDSGRRLLAHELTHVVQQTG